MRISKKTIKNHIDKELNNHTVENLIIQCYAVIKDLREYPNDNKNQIKYYTTMYNTLLTY